MIGPYQILEKLGRGGMADVYKALHTQLKVNRAIKFIRPEFVTDDDFRARFQNEAQAVAQLEHNHIVRIHDFGHDDGRFYMVMQYVEGQDLKNILSSHGKLPISRSVELVVSVAEALAYAHTRSLIHRDIKPDNIMVDSSGKPTLMDFGIAKLLTASAALTQTNVGIGTPAYMAPEQAQGLEVTAATDIYSLTIVLFELLTGQQPFSADTPIAVMMRAINDPMPLPRHLNPGVSEDLQAVILKGTAKDPAMRYQSAHALIADLRAITMGSGIGEAISTLPIAEVDSDQTILNASLPKTNNRMIAGWFVIPILATVLASGWWFKDDLTKWASSLDKSTSSLSTVDERSDDRAVSINGPATLADKSNAKATRLVTFNDVLKKGEQLKRTLHLDAGDVVFLDVHASEQETVFQLRSKLNDELLVKTTSDHGPIEVVTAGQYQFSITQNERSGALDFDLIRLAQPVLDGGNYALNSFRAARTRVPGQTMQHSVQLSAGDVVFLDVSRAKEKTDFSLVRTTDQHAVFSATGDAGPHKIRKTGTYLLNVDPHGDQLANFAFKLHQLTPAVIEGGLIESGEQFSTHITQPGQKTLYEFDLRANSTLFLDINSVTNPAEFILASSGAEIFRSSKDVGPIKVKRGGRISLTVDPQGDKLADTKAVLHVLKPAIIDGGKVTSGQTFTAQNDQPGQVTQYELALVAGSKVFLDVKDKRQVRYVLLQDGKELFAASGDIGPISIEKTGNLIIRVDPKNDALVDATATVNVNMPEEIAQVADKKPAEPDTQREAAPTTTTKLEQTAQPKEMLRNKVLAQQDALKQARQQENSEHSHVAAEPAKVSSQREAQSPANNPDKNAKAIFEEALAASSENSTLATVIYHIGRSGEIDWAKKLLSRIKRDKIVKSMYKTLAGLGIVEGLAVTGDIDAALRYGKSLPRGKYSDGLLRGLTSSAFLNYARSGHVTEALKKAAKLRKPLDQAQAYSGIASYHNYVRQFDRVAPALDLALEPVKRIRDKEAKANAHFSLALSAAKSGDPARVDNFVDGVDNGFTKVMVFTELAKQLVVLGDEEGAREAIAAGERAVAEADKAVRSVGSSYLAAAVASVDGLNAVKKYVIDNKLESYSVSSVYLNVTRMFAEQGDYDAAHETRRLIDNAMNDAALISIVNGYISERLFAEALAQTRFVENRSQFAGSLAFIAAELLVTQSNSDLVAVSEVAPIF